MGNIPNIGESYRFKWCSEVLQKHLNVAFNL